MSHNARYARLAIEYTKLMNLAERSSFIKIRPVEVQPGWPPEKYIITYTCKGVASVDKRGGPSISELHQVSMYMGSDYPFKEPYLKWLTPIWHPNIDHEEPHHVCTNNVQNWFAAKPLAELVLAMGEMVQYKHYHAKWVSPFPLDRAAADWVLEVAEPRGILGPDKPFDDRPLLQPQRMRKKRRRSVSGNPHEPRNRIKIGLSPVLMRSYGGHVVNRPVETVPFHASAPRRGRAIRFGTRKAEDVDVTTYKPAAERNTKRRLPAIQTQDTARYSLEIHKDGELQRVEQIEKSLVSIGRGALDKAVDLELKNDPTISRLHAVLERDENGAFWLTVKGQNPVLVGGRAVPRERSIWVDVGQQIEICSYSIKLQQAS